MKHQPDHITPRDEKRLALKRARALRQWFGRPTAAQNRLLERLLAALVVDFEESGPDAIRTVRDKDPVNYLRLVAVMVPRPHQLDLNGGRFNDEEIIDALATVRDLAAAHAASLGKCIEGTGEPQDTPGLPALPQADRVP